MVIAPKWLKIRTYNWLKIRTYNLARKSPDMTPKNFRKGARLGSRDPVNVRALNANTRSSKTAKDTNFKFGKHAHSKSLDMTQLTPGFISTYSISTNSYVRFCLLDFERIVSDIFGRRKGRPMKPIRRLNRQWNRYRVPQNVFLFIALNTHVMLTVNLNIACFLLSVCIDRAS